MKTLRSAWVTFDCYGTLIDWESGIRDFFCSTTGREDLLAKWENIQFAMIQGPYRRYADILADSLRETLQRSGLEYRPEMGASFARALTSWRPFPQTIPALEQLRRQGLRLGIISNIDDALLAETVKHFPVSFDALVTAEQARAYKPSAAPFILALERIGGILRDGGMPPNEVTLVAFGDRYDLATARARGMQTVFVNRSGKKLSMPVDAEISGLDELPSLFSAG